MSAVASTVLPVHIIAALPNTIILVVADADAVVAAQVNTRVHIGGPVISTLELVEVGVVLDLVSGLRLVVWLGTDQMPALSSPAYLCTNQTLNLCGHDEASRDLIVH